jgi:hypothetical protein
MNKRPKVLILATVAAVGTVLNTVLLIVLLSIQHRQIAAQAAAWALPPASEVFPEPTAEQRRKAQEVNKELARELCPPGSGCEPR